PLFPYTTLFRSVGHGGKGWIRGRSGLHRASLAAAGRRPHDPDQPAAGSVGRFAATGHATSEVSRGLAARAGLPVHCANPSGRYRTGPHDGGGPGEAYSESKPASATTQSGVAGSPATACLPSP